MPTKGDLDLRREAYYQPAAEWESERLFSPRSAFVPLANAVYRPIKEIYDYMISFPSVEQESSDDVAWQPVRVLGKGGHGIAGLWVKDDHSSSDHPQYIVIKEEMCPSESDELGSWKLTKFKSKSRPDLAAEAWIMEQLNQQDCPNIIELRGFKSQGRGKKQRFYYEFAPNGDLYKLKTRYRAWNQYIPEEFLWFLLRGLAEAQQTLVTAYWKDTYHDELVMNEEQYILHLDLKPENIFLGDPEAPSGKEKSFESEYPCPKMADFGLAVVTYRRDKANPRHLRWRKTPGYNAPESANPDVTWNKRVIGKKRRRIRSSFEPTDEEVAEWRRMETVDSVPGYIFDRAYDIWPIGKIMFELMTLRSEDHFETDSWPTEDEYYEQFDEEITNILLNTNKLPEYSEELKDTILRCLRLDPSRRPTAEELLDSADQWLARAKRNLQEENCAIPRLYYQGNEINEMPVGDRNALKEPLKRRRWKEYVESYKPLVDHSLEPLLDGRWDPKARAIKEPTERKYVGGKKVQLQTWVVQWNNKDKVGKPMTGAVGRGPPAGIREKELYNVRRLIPAPSTVPSSSSDGDSDDPGSDSGNDHGKDNGNGEGNGKEKSNGKDKKQPQGSGKGKRKQATAITINSGPNKRPKTAHAQGHTSRAPNEQNQVNEAMWATVRNRGATVHNQGAQDKSGSETDSEGNTLEKGPQEKLVEDSPTESERQWRAKEDEEADARQAARLAVLEGMSSQDRARVNFYPQGQPSLGDEQAQTQPLDAVAQQAIDAVQQQDLAQTLPALAQAPPALAAAPPPRRKGADWNTINQNLPTLPEKRIRRKVVRD